MYSADDYAIALVVYLVAGLGCMLVWWRFTAWIGWRPVRELLRLAVFALIFTPWYAEESVQAERLAQADGGEQKVQVMLELAEGTTAQAGAEPLYLAPAAIIAGFEWLTGSPEVAARAAMPLVLALTASLVLVIFVALLRGLRAMIFQRTDSSWS